jgi:Mitochondrial 39-S ribosomal protein L47 (MRP-L47)
MLLTEEQLSRRKGLVFPQPERIRKVRKSMGAIKHVLGERKRHHLAHLQIIKKEQTESSSSTSKKVDSPPQQHQSSSTSNIVQQ